MCSFVQMHLIVAVQVAYMINCVQVDLATTVVTKSHDHLICNPMVNTH